MRRSLALFAVLLLSCGLVSAKPLAREDVPKPLVPWIDWVLTGQEKAQCPFLNGKAHERVCAWPAALRLELHGQGGRFTQRWRVYADSWAALPGDGKRWPQAVLVDGVRASVVQRGGNPHVRLKRGVHSVSGAFRWDSMPELLQVPAETGILALSLRGKPVPFPVRDRQGRLWLQKRRKAGKEKARLEVVVHRHVVDDIPLKLNTRIQIKVSGKSREVLLGRALPENFVPMSLTGPLPARLEPDGRLRVQVRPGTWNLTLTARHEGPAETIALGDPKGDWDKDEVWVFESRNDLRLVSVEGPPPIDPQQTELPQSWRRFPAYLMRAGDSLKLVERRRGDADPEPDRLTLARKLWLDFDGKGWSVQDTIRGKLHRSWRLEMAPGTSLGRVAVGGQDQFITSLDKDGPAGIEVRQGSVNLVADSRVEGGARSVPAVGWAHDFDQVSGSLQLPPGWRIVHAWGVDRASPTWISVWSLLDFFLVLIIAFAVGRLYGRGWGLLALAAVVLAWHEPIAPRWVWLFVLAGEALVRALPEGKVQKAASACRIAAWAVALLIVIPFSVVQVRQALYPQLESKGSGTSLRALSRMGNVSMNMAMPAALGAASAGAVMEIEADEAAPMMQMKGARKRQRLRKSKMSLLSSSGYSGKPAQHYAPDPNSRVNTGPGLPTWNWRTISLSWQGPVKKDQQLRLLLLSPRCGFGLTIVRMSLIILLMLVMLNLPLGDWWRTLRGGGAGRAVARLFPALLLLLTFAGRVEAASTFPPKEMLNELRNRLTEKPECAPHCADSPLLRLEVVGNVLRARMEVNAEAATAVPLPGGAKQWSPASVLVDGVPAKGLRRRPDGQLWLPVSRGAHQIILEGPLPDRETVQLPLPMKSRRVEAKVSGWVLDGLHEDGLADDTLRLTRTRGKQGRGKKTLEPGVLPPFMMVERRLVLGLSWRVVTTVSRLTPTGSPIVVEVPLLAGESVMSEGIRVVKGKALVNMSPQLSRVQWSSNLKHAGVLKLKAPDSAPWIERWLLDASPVWHVEPKGIPTVHGSSSRGRRTREWRPRPGESVEIDIRRPEGVPGQTLTIDRAALSVKPGLRATDVSVTMSLRSSRGGQHTVLLPEGADLQEVRIDGQVQPIRQEGRKVTLPIRPGAHTAKLDWRQDGGIRLFYRTPKVDLGSPSVNAGITVQMPGRRWTLFLGGPSLGPAVLFWSLLAVFFLMAVGLGRIRLTPLRWTHWFLLSLGLTQVPIPVAAFIALWLILLGWRGKNPLKTDWQFNLMQAVIVIVTLSALGCLFGSITHGLLGSPDMQISGNGSGSRTLMWYQDRSAAVLPSAWIFSVPLMVYRAAMLCWALWLASSLLGWLKWGWGRFGEGGLWRNPPPKPKPVTAPPAPKR